MRKQAIMLENQEKQSVKIPTEDIDDIVSVTDLKITSLIWSKE